MTIYTQLVNIQEPTHEKRGLFSHYHRFHTGLDHHFWYLHGQQKPQESTPTGRPYLPPPRPTPATPAAGDTSPTPAPTPVPGAFTLTVSAPVNEALLDKNSTTVTGKTVAGAAVTVLSETSETLAVANSSGDFSVPITLEGGYNRITVTAFDKDGKSSSQSLVVTYTSSKI